MAIAALHLLLLVPVICSAPIWHVDEGRLSSSALEMIESGEILTPRLGGEPMSLYPPLNTWLMAASGALFGVSEFSMRLPAALASAGLVIGVALLGARLAGPRAGVLSSSALATLPAFALHVRFCRADVLAAFFAVLALERFLAWVQGGGRVPAALSAALVALGVLAKGPIALAILGLGVAAWGVSARDAGFVRRAPWIGCAAAFLLVAVPWYAAMHLRHGPDFLRQNLLNENVSAFASGYQQRRPVHFYFSSGLLVLLPWILLLLGAARVRRAPGVPFAALWAAGLLLLLTASSAKRITYLVYAAPAVALASGIALDALLREAPAGLRRAMAAGGAVVAAAGAAAALIPTALWTGSKISRIRESLPLLGLAAVLVGGAWSWISLRRGPLPGAACLASVLALGLAAQGVFLAHAQEPEAREGTAFCARVRASIPPAEPVHRLPKEEGDWSLGFQLRRVLRPLPAEGGLLLAEETQIAARYARRSILDGFQDDRGRRLVLARVAP